MLAALVTLSFVATAGAQSADDARPRVVVSIHPLYDLVRQVAGADAEVVRLLPPGVSTHTFDPTPRDLLRVIDADLVIINGGLDLWATRLLEASGHDARRLEVIGLPSVQAAVREQFPQLTVVTTQGATLGFNSHVWLDPILMASALPDIAVALGAIDERHAAGYLARAQALAQDLVDLDAELHQLMAPVAGAAFVPFHDAWPYFAARYGLDLIVEIEPYPGKEPSPAYLAYALDLIRASGATAIFSEVQLNRRPAEVLAADAGIELYELDPKGGVPGRLTYQDLLRYNANVLLTALSR